MRIGKNLKYLFCAFIVLYALVVSLSLPKNLNLSDSEDFLMFLMIVAPGLILPLLVKIFFGEKGRGYLICCPTNIGILF